MSLVGGGWAATSAVLIALWLWQRVKRSRAETVAANLKADLAERTASILKLQRFVEARDVLLERLSKDLKREREANALAAATVDQLRADVAACAEPGIVRRRLARMLEDLRAPRDPTAARDPGS